MLPYLSRAYTMPIRTSQSTNFASSAHFCVPGTHLMHSAAADGAVDRHVDSNCVELVALADALVFQSFPVALATLLPLTFFPAVSFFLSFPLSFFLTVFLFLLCFVHKQESGCLTRAHAWKWGENCVGKEKKVLSNFLSLMHAFSLAEFSKCYCCFNTPCRGRRRCRGDM